MMLLLKTALPDKTGRAVQFLSSTGSLTGFDFFGHPSKRFFTGGTDARFARYRRRANSLFAATDSATDKAMQSR